MWGREGGAAGSELITADWTGLDNWTRKQTDKKEIWREGPKRNSQSWRFLVIRANPKTPP